jgi:lysophospholipase L1-like esterase
MLKQGFGLRGAMGFACGFIIALTLTNMPKWFSPWKASVVDRRIKRAILFGDSITQEACDPALQGWVSSLTAYWIRRIDVVNRGFGGYTSRWGLKLYESVVLDQRPDIVFLFFGANDAVVAEHAQHVPLAEYKQNLSIMVRKALSMSITVFLLTPPPVYEPVLELRNKEKGKKLLTDRVNSNTLRFVNACKAVGKEFDVPVIDNWTTMGGDSAERGDYLRDGLHLNEQGNRQVFRNIVGLIGDKFQHLRPENVKLFQPHWSEIVENESILG